jgi:hypothetical protein
MPLSAVVPQALAQDGLDAATLWQRWPGVLVLWGNVLDHFDTALYWLLVPYMASCFFPAHDRVVQLMAAYGLLAVDWVGKPLGAVWGPWCARRWGVSTLMAWGCMGVAVATAGVAFLPTYKAAGLWAPLALGLLRWIQAFFASAHYAVGALFWTQYRGAQRATASEGWYQVAGLLGIALASGLVALLGCYTDLAQTWRVPFVLGVATAVLGVCWRVVGQLASCIRAHEQSQLCTWQAHCQVLWQARWHCIPMLLVVGLSHMTYVIPFSLLNTWVPQWGKVAFADLVAWNTALLVLDAALLLLLGQWLVGRSVQVYMRYSAWALAGVTCGLFAYLPAASLWGVTTLRAVYVTLGVLFCLPLRWWCLSQVPPQHAYAVIGWVYGLGGLLGRLLPVGVLGLWHCTGSTWPAGLLLGGWCAWAGWWVCRPAAGRCLSKTLLA